MFNQNKTYFKTVLIIKILATDVLHMYKPWRKFSAYTCELGFGGHPKTVAPPSGHSSSPGCTTCWPAPSSTRPGLSLGSALSHNPATMTHRNIFLSEIQISQCHSSPSPLFIFCLQDPIYMGFVKFTISCFVCIPISL